MLSNKIVTEEVKAFTFDGKPLKNVESSLSNGDSSPSEEYAPKFDEVNMDEFKNPYLNSCDVDKEFLKPITEDPSKEDDISIDFFTATKKNMNSFANNEEEKPSNANKQVVGYTSIEIQYDSPKSSTNDKSQIPNFETQINVGKALTNQSMGRVITDSGQSTGKNDDSFLIKEKYFLEKLDNKRKSVIKEDTKQYDQLYKNSNCECDKRNEGCICNIF